MDRQYYRSGQFAKKAEVSIRTLRYYDKEGLLAPSHYTESGYRLYTDEDLLSLQQILALKFLGFSLDEIKALLRTGPRSLGDVLAQQKEMMAAKRAQLDGIIQAIDETQKLMNDGECDWDSLVKVIQAIQMDQNRDWVNKYFTPEQLEEMKKLSEQSYSEEAREKLASRMGEWTESDQQRVGAQWAEVTQGIVRLSSANADPASPEAQQVAKLYSDLIAGFTGGDPEIAKGLTRFWQQHESLPENRKPLASPYTGEQQEWLEKALEVYRQKS